MELTLTKFVTNHCDPPVLRRLSSECVASMLTHPLCWMPVHTESSCSLIGCREMMLENVTLDKSGYSFNILELLSQPASGNTALLQNHLQSRNPVSLNLKFITTTVTTANYRNAPHNVSVNYRPHIRHGPIRLLYYNIIKPLCYNCLPYSVQ